MNDILLIILVLVVAMGGVMGVAYLLDKRGKKPKSAARTLIELGPLGRAVVLVGKVLLGLTVTSLICTFAFNSLPFAWLSASWLALYVLDGLIYRIIRLTGK